MISKTGRSTVGEHHEGGVVVANGGPIGSAGRQAATVGDDENPSFAVVTDDYLTGADCGIHDASSRCGDIEYHLVRAVGNLAARPVGGLVPQTIAGRIGCRIPNGRGQLR